MQFQRCREYIRNKKKKTSGHIQRQHKFVIDSQLKLSTRQTSLTKSMIQTNAKKTLRDYNWTLYRFVEPWYTLFNYFFHSRQFGYMYKVTQGRQSYCRLAGSLTGGKVTWGHIYYIFYTSIKFGNKILPQKVSKILPNSFWIFFFIIIYCFTSAIKIQLKSLG